MTDKQEKEQLKQDDPKRANHLTPFQWKKGQSGNLKGRPKGAVGMTKRIELKLLEQIGSGGTDQFADALASAIVKSMLRDPVKAERLIAKFMDRDEGPVEKTPAVSIEIGTQGKVPQPPPMDVDGDDGAPTLSVHVGRLQDIIKERGLDIPSLKAAEDLTVSTPMTAEEELLS